MIRQTCSIILNIIIIFVVYSFIVSQLKSISYEGIQEHNSSQQKLRPLQQIQDIQSNLLFSSAQQGREQTLLGSNSQYYGLIKKFIAQHFKDVEPLANTILENLQKILPQAWLSGILGLVYFMFTFTFGGGFSYFNRNIKELSNHQAKIQRGMDCAQILQGKSKQLKQKSMIHNLQDLQFKQLDSLIDFIVRDQRKVKIIKSSKRQDISDIVYSFLINKTYKLDHLYFNLEVVPFNHESGNKNLQAYILQDIIYGILFSKDRGLSLAFLKTLIKILRYSVRNICSVFITEWINSNTLAYIFGLGIGYKLHPQISILFLIFKFLHAAYQYFSSFDPSIKSVQEIGKRYILIDKFELIRQQLLSKNEVFNEEALSCFAKLIKNMIHITKNTNNQIILIIQEPMLMELLIQKVCSLDQLKMFTFYNIQPLSYEDSSYISKYLNINDKLVRRTLQWSTDISQIKGVRSNNQLQILDNIIETNIRKIDEILLEFPRLKNQTALFLLFMIINKLAYYEKMQTSKIQKINKNLSQYIKNRIENCSLELSQEQNKKCDEDLGLILRNYQQSKLSFSSLRQRYLRYKKSTKKEDAQGEAIYRQVYIVLNKKQVLFQQQFYSKTACISTYVWCKRLL